MRYMLDSNVVIGAMLATSDLLRERMASCDEGDLVVSAIAYAEVAHGAMHGKPPPVELLDRFLADIPTLPFDESAGRAYASLPFRRGSYDRLIAAHALSLDLTMVTDNEKHFGDVPGLRVENWTADLT
jgi:tRNA(fMet)-specific endonuclease VapC